MKIITVINQKGGVGKTTTANILARHLGKDNKVLAIDLDPQSNLTVISDVELDSIKNIYKAFREFVDKDDIEPKSYIKSSNQGYSIISGSLSLASSDMEFSNVMIREKILMHILEKIKDDYDYVIIDTPPTLNILSINALVVADEVIIPTTASLLGIQGILQLYKSIGLVKKYHNPKLKIKGIVVNMLRHTKVQKKYLMELEELCSKLGINLFRQSIRMGTDIEKAQDQGYDILKEGSQVANDYKQMIKEYGL